MKYDTRQSGMSGLEPECVRLAPDGTNLGLFKISFSTFSLARFVAFGANQTNLADKLEIPAPPRVVVSAETLE